MISLTEQTFVRAYAKVRSWRAAADRSWRVTNGQRDGRRLRIDWSKMGGSPTAPPTRWGLGTRLIGLSAEREFDGAVGLRCSLDVPLAAQAATAMSPTLPVR